MMINAIKDGFRWALRAALCITCGLISPVLAQNGGFEDVLGRKLLPQTSAKAEFVASLVPSTAKPGEEVTLNVTAKLPPHSYIFAMYGDFDQQTRIETKQIVGLEPLEEKFHPDREPETEMNAILKQALSKFHGDVTWSKKFRIIPGTAIEKVAIDLELSGQYCSEGDGGQCTLIRPPVALHAAIGDEKPSEKPTARFVYSSPALNGDDVPAAIDFVLGPSKATSGKTAKLVITMKLSKGYHTFSSTFDGEGGQPTVLVVDKLYGLKKTANDLVPNREPELKFEKAVNANLEIYHDEITWTQEFEVIPGADPNRFGIEGKLKYQVCNASKCVPRSVKFTIGVTNDDVNPPSNVDSIQDQDSVAATPFSKPRLQDKGLITFLLTAVVAAIVALLTPCVFPMVPITVSFFLKQNEAKRGSTLVLALVFSGSIIAAFVILGVGIAAIFGATKLNELANSWILNLFLASVFFVFALNMLGAFEIQVPSWLLTMTSSGEQTGGYVGVIFMALTFVLTSFSCTFAFVGSLLIAASTGQFYWPILGMLAFGTTFALPFFVLALLPGMLKSLPKSGGWLNAVKVVMGFVELGVAIKYFSVVDQQWNSAPVLFDFTNAMTLWAALSFCTGLYLLGQFRLSHDTPVQGLSTPRVLLAVGFLTLGALFGIGVTQPNRDTWLLNQLVSFAPARLEGESHELQFDRAVSVATAFKKPLFLDFTGVNCVNCRLMEKRMAKPGIRDRLERFVQAQLYCDSVPLVSDKKLADEILTRNITLEKEWFGDVTLPSYAIVSSDGKTILASYSGLAPQDSDFVQFLDEGYAKWSKLR